MKHRIILAALAVFAFFCFSMKMPSNALVDAYASSPDSILPVDASIHKQCLHRIPAGFKFSEHSDRYRSDAFSEFVAQRTGTMCFTPYGQCEVEAAPIGSPCCCPDLGCGYIGE